MLAGLLQKEKKSDDGPKRDERVNKAKELFPSLMEKIDDVDASEYSDEIKKAVKVDLFAGYKEAILAEEDAAN